MGISAKESLYRKVIEEFYKQEFLYSLLQKYKYLADLTQIHFRYKHTLDVSPANVTILYKPLKNTKLDFTLSTSYTSYNLLTNGPTGICVNSQCQQPIFTEAWIIIGINRYAESMITIILCCSRR